MTSNPDSNHDGDVIVQSNGLSIRRWRATDVSSIARHGNNKKIWDNLRNRMPHPYLDENAEWWIKRSSDPSNFVRSGLWTPETGAQGPALPCDYAITVHDEAVGSIGLDFGAESDVYFRTAEIGYWLSEEHWGKGVMSTLVPGFVNWAWKTFGVLVRLNAYIFEKNVNSRKLLEKAGFKVEGRMENHFVKNGVLGNAIMLGALRPNVQA